MVYLFGYLIFTEGLWLKHVSQRSIMVPPDGACLLENSGYEGERVLLSLSVPESCKNNRLNGTVVIVSVRKFCFT